MPTVQVPPEASELLQEIANSVFKSKKTIVVTGAGISTNSGIPDFRSENGLYSLIQEQFDAAAKHDTSQTDDSFAGTEQGCSSSTDPEIEYPAKRRKLCGEAVGALSAHRSGDTASALSLESGPPSCAEQSVAAPTDNLASTNSNIRDPMNESHKHEETEAAARHSGLAVETGCTLQQQSERKGETTDDEGVHKALHCDEYSSPRGRALRSRDAPPENDATTSVRHGPPKRATSLPPSASDPGLPSDSRAHAMNPGLRNTPSSVPSIARFLDAQSFTRSRARSAERAGVRNMDSLGSSPPRVPHSSSQALGRSSGRASTPKRNGGIFMSLPQLGLSGGKQAPALVYNSRTPVRLPRSGIVFSSSPLSSPPPVLFDPFQETSSATQPSSSETGSTASSETDETPPSSIPTLLRQSSSRSRSSLPNLKGRDMFDASIWADPVRTSVFYTFATTLRQRVRDVEPTTSHRFISHLRDRGKLVRCYTQNIDQIEEKVGLSTSLQQGPGHKSRFSRRSTGGAQVQKLQEPNDASDVKVRRLGRENSGVECVFLHGSLQSLRCFLCGRHCEWDESGRSLETLSGQQPECPHCVGAAVAREERGKRTLGIGKLRPDIVLYGEEHPNAHLIEPIVNHDLALYPDFLLILGTSLKVHGLKILVREFAKTVHCRGGKVVFVNFTKPPESSWGDIIDYWVQWDCDAWVSDLQHRIPLLWMPPGTKLPSTSKRKRESSGEGRSVIKKQTSTADKEQSTVKPGTQEKTEDYAIGNTAQASSQAVPKLPPTRSEMSTVVNPETSSKLPQRPMSTREDRINGAFLTWQITRDLRRISGSIGVPAKDVSSSVQLEEAPPSPTVVVAQEQNAKQETKVTPSRVSLPASSPCQEEGGRPRHEDPPASASQRQQKSGPAKKPALRRSAPGWVYLPENAPEALAVARKQLEQSFSFGLDDTGKPGNVDHSLLSAVKSNPRRRKRKMIDGVEVALPTIVARPAPQSSDLPRQVEGEAHVLPSPKTASPTMLPANQDAILHTSPRILSDLNRVSMNSRKLPPILSVSQQSRPQKQEQEQEQGCHHQHYHDGFQRPTKPMPLEPQSPPSGPLKSIGPNVMRWRDHPAAFSYFDSLVPMLKTPLVKPWTPEEQLRKETEAAVALDRLRGGL